MTSFFNILCGTTKGKESKNGLESGQWIETKSEAEKFFFEFGPPKVVQEHGGHYDVDGSQIDGLSGNSLQLENRWATKLQEEFEERRERQTRKQEECLDRARELYQRSQTKEYQDYVQQQKMYNEDREFEEDSACFMREEEVSPRKATPSGLVLRQETPPASLRQTTPPMSMGQHALMQESRLESGISAMYDHEDVDDVLSVVFNRSIEVEGEKSIASNPTDPAEVRRLHEAVKTYTSRVSRQQKEARKEANKILHSLSPDQYGEIVEIKQIAGAIDMDFIRWASSMSIGNDEQMPHAHVMRRAKEELFDATPTELRDFVEFYPFKHIFPLLHAVE